MEDNKGIKEAESPEVVVVEGPSSSSTVEDTNVPDTAAATTTTTAPAPINGAVVSNKRVVAIAAPLLLLQQQQELVAQLLEFQYQQHSLRVSASNIAAMVGLHPWKKLPELLMQLVYQGRDGQRLLRRDSELIGLTLVSEEAALLQLATKAGESTRKALVSALKVKDGTKTVASTEAAKKLKEQVIREATKTGKLKPKELKVLREGARSAVDTGYGTAHEDGALDLYEEQCGWPVEERNAEVRVWPFARLEDAPDTAAKEGSSGKPTVVPLKHAAAACWNRVAAQMSTEQKESDESATATSKPPKTVDLNEPSKEASIETAQAGVLDKVAGDKERPIDRKPFFSILGSVDGIRDELAPCSTSGGDDSPNDDDSWVLRKVVVECKHRMSRIYAVPPLYEQIQTTAYCLMHQVTEADIVQVMRKERAPKRKAAAKPEIPVNTLDDWVQKQPTEEGKEPPVPPPPPPPPPPVPTAKENAARAITITTSRISLDDPVMQHRTNWNEVVLPRLRSFVEAAFSVRSSDDKRYQLLIALSDATNQEQQKAAWRILHKECPWLESCDTAYHRDL